MVGGHVDHAVGPHDDDQPLDGAELAAPVLDDQAEDLVGVARIRYRPVEPVHEAEDRGDPV